MDHPSPAIAVLFHRLGPYHFARLQAAAGCLPVVAVESSGLDQTYAWDKVAGSGQFQRLTLFEGADALTLPVAEVVRRLSQVLDEMCPAVVVVAGWADTFALGALLWCGKNRVPVVIMSESTVWDEQRKPLKEAIKRQVVGLASAALVGGTPHRDYLVQLGLPAPRIFLGYDAVDNDYYTQKTRAARAETLQLRHAHGLPEKFFLASNRFVEKKNLPRLVQAYARYRAQCGAEPWQLVLLGDGELRAVLVQLIASLGLQDSILLPGFKQYAELPVYYALAGAFVHASTTEQWGLVVNEAMASALPVLVSHRCGCAADLVADGINGFTFDPANVEQLAGQMGQVAAAGFPLADFGRASLRRIAAWGPDRFASGLQQAVQTALQAGPVRPSLGQRAILAALLRG